MSMLQQSMLQVSTYGHKVQLFIVQLKYLILLYLK